MNAKVYNVIRKNPQFLDNPTAWRVCDNLVSNDYRSHITFDFYCPDGLAVKVMCSNFQEALGFYTSVVPLTEKMENFKELLCKWENVNNLSEIKVHKSVPTDKTALFRYIKERVKAIFVKPLVTGSSAFGLKVLFDENKNVEQETIMVEAVDCTNEEATDAYIIRKYVRKVTSDFLTDERWQSPNRIFKSPFRDTVKPELIEKVKEFAKSHLVEKSAELKNTKALILVTKFFEI